MKQVFAVALLVFVFVSGCGISTPPPEGTPKLVVLLVVDQLGAQLLERYDTLFDGGFRRLHDRGLRFSEAHHGHSGTTTAPGHATIATGCDPARHGLISNYWYDRESGEIVYSVEDARYGTSPRRLECSALGDWLKQRYRRSKVYTVSTKDRSAVLLGGRKPDAAYWYDGAGKFVSSPYYRDHEPAWLAELNEEALLDRYFGSVWEPAGAAAEAGDELGVFDVDLGPLEEDFPHAMGEVSFSPDETYYMDLVYSPSMDGHLLEVARRIVRNEELGRDEFPDLLAVGLSALDAVGHEYGANSREVLDLLLRLDAYLEGFFQFLDDEVGLDRVGIALTADHGSVPLPELQAARGLPGRRADTHDVLCMQRIEKQLQLEFGDFDWLRPGPFFALDEGRPEVSVDALESKTRELLEACRAVERIWLASELARPATSDMQRRFARSHHPERSSDFRVQWREYFLSSRGVPASHGSPYSYDTHVPMILLRAGIEPGVVTEPVETVDLAPTLADWMGVEPSEDIAGRSLVLEPVAVSKPAARTSAGD